MLSACVPPIAPRSPAVWSRVGASPTTASATAAAMNMATRPPKAKRALITSPPDLGRRALGAGGQVAATEADLRAEPQNLGDVHPDGKSDGGRPDPADHLLAQPVRPWDRRVYGELDDRHEPGADDREL